MRPMKRRDLLAFAALARVRGQEPAEPPEQWVCPMDPDVRAAKPGLCPRCRMALAPGIPDRVEYPLRVSVTPRAWKAGQRVAMRFEVLHPQTGRRVRDLQIVHEKLFHLFLVSEDLHYFAHEHPELQRDGTFLFETTLPKPGVYRLLGDFYPAGATPQLAVQTIVSADAAPLGRVQPRFDTGLRTASGENLGVRLTTEPERPLAGLKTLLFFDLDPAGRLEQYLGAWGHLLCASADLIDLIHTHPFIAEGGPRLQFNIVFPRPGVHRLWPQFQRAGVVNTVRFDVEALAL